MINRDLRSKGGSKTCNIPLSPHLFNGPELVLDDFPELTLTHSVTVEEDGLDSQARYGNLIGLE